jgi:hypothetical protein
MPWHDDVERASVCEYLKIASFPPIEKLIIILGKKSFDPKKIYGPRKTEILARLTKELLRKFSLILPCYLVHAIPYIDATFTNKTTGETSVYKKEDFTQTNRHIRYFGFIDIDLPLERVKDHGEALIPGRIDGSLFTYANHKEIKQQWWAFMKENADEPNEFFMNAAPMWKETTERTVGVARALHERGCKPFIFFTGGRGYRILWEDVNLFFLVDNKESYAKRFQYSIGPAYFQELGYPDLMNQIDKNIYDKAKGVKPDVERHPDTHLYPVLIPLDTFKDIHFVSHQLDAALTNRIVHFWKRDVPELMPKDTMMLMRDGSALDATLRKKQPLLKRRHEAREDEPTSDTWNASFKRVRHTDAAGDTPSSGDAAAAAASSMDSPAPFTREQMETAANDMLHFIQTRPYGQGVTRWRDLKPCISPVPVTSATGEYLGERDVHGFILAFDGLTHCVYRGSSAPNHSVDTKIFWYCNLETRMFHQQCQSDKCARAYEELIRLREEAREKNTFFKGVDYHRLPYHFPTYDEPLFQNPFGDASSPDPTGATTTTTMADAIQGEPSVPLSTTADTIMVPGGSIGTRLSSVTIPCDFLVSEDDYERITAPPPPPPPSTTCIINESTTPKIDEKAEKDADNDDHHQDIDFDECPDYTDDAAADLGDDEEMDIPDEYQTHSAPSVARTPVSISQTPVSIGASGAAAAVAAGAAAAASPPPSFPWENLPPDEKWALWLTRITPPPGGPPNLMHQCYTTIMRGENCEIRGTAGSGKTTTWEGIYHHYKQAYPYKTVLELASYGVAAGQLLGHTIQKWTGVGIKTYRKPGELRAKLHELWHEVRTEMFPNRAVHASAARVGSVQRIKSQRRITEHEANDRSGLFPYRMTHGKAHVSILDMVNAQSGACTQLAGEVGIVRSGSSSVSLDEKTRLYQSRRAYMLDEKKPLLRRWEMVDVMVLGEFSCIDPCLLEFLDVTARIARGCNAPFGGIQVIAHGDPNQRKAILPADYPAYMPRHVWDTRVWKQCFGSDGNSSPGRHASITLLQSQRQANDLTFFHLLQRLVTRSLTRQDVELLRTRMKPFDKPRRTIALFPMRREVWAYNDTQCSTGGDGWHTYTSVLTFLDGPSKGTSLSGHEWTHEIRDALSITPVLRIRQGTPCMYQNNVDPMKQIYNGAMCGVVGFAEPRASISASASATPFPILYFPPAVEVPHQDISHRTYVQHFIEQKRFITWNGVLTLVSVRYLPFDAGFACTIAKSQGLTLPSIRVSIDSHLKSHEDLHVALSRVRRLEDIHITALNENVLRPWMVRP